MKVLINAHLADSVKGLMYDNVQEPIRCQCEHCKLKSFKLLCYVNGKSIGPLCEQQRMKSNMYTIIP